MIARISDGVSARLLSVAELWRRDWDGGWLGRAAMEATEQFLKIKGIVGREQAWARR
jgi:hypothetical protein